MTASHKITFGHAASNSMQSRDDVGLKHIRVPPVCRNTIGVGTTELRDEIEAWVNEGGAGDDVEQ